MTWVPQDEALRVLYEWSPLAYWAGIVLSVAPLAFLVALSLFVKGRRR